MTKYALDTNVLIYLHDNQNNSLKRKKALELVVNGGDVSPQVLSEYLNVCQKKLKMSKQEALSALSSWFPYCELSLLTKDVFKYAANLVLSYDFQMFDAIIVATSLRNNCTILYSEDMQDGLIIEKTLKIVNPFKF